MPHSASMRPRVHRLRCTVNEDAKQNVCHQDENGKKTLPPRRLARLLLLGGEWRARSVEGVEAVAVVRSVHRSARSAHEGVATYDEGKQMAIPKNMRKMSSGSTWLKFAYCALCDGVELNTLSESV